jgi:hypothetical protein
MITLHPSWPDNLGPMRCGFGVGGHEASRPLEAETDLSPLQTASSARSMICRGRTSVGRQTGAFFVPRPPSFGAHAPGSAFSQPTVEVRLSSLGPRVTRLQGGFTDTSAVFRPIVKWDLHWRGVGGNRLHGLRGREWPRRDGLHLSEDRGGRQARLLGSRAAPDRRLQEPSRNG